MKTRRGSAKRKHDARVAWLAAHPEKFQHVPGLHDDVTDDGRQHLEALRAEMCALDLVAGRQHEIQRETIRRLVSELRGQTVDAGEW